SGTAAAPARPGGRIARAACSSISARGGESRRATEEDQVVSVLEERVETRPSFRCASDIAGPGRGGQRLGGSGEVMDEAFHRLPAGACHLPSFGEDGGCLQPGADELRIGAV